MTARFDPGTGFAERRVEADGFDIRYMEAGRRARARVLPRRRRAAAEP